MRFSSRSFWVPMTFARIVSMIIRGSARVCLKILTRAAFDSLRSLRPGRVVKRREREGLALSDRRESKGLPSQQAQGVGRLAVQQQFVMDVRARGSARRPDVANDVAFAK